jgi:hypothetical protein
MFMILRSTPFVASLLFPATLLGSLYADQCSMTADDASSVVSAA